MTDLIRRTVHVARVLVDGLGRYYFGGNMSKQLGRQPSAFVRLAPVACCCGLGLLLHGAPLLAQTQTWKEGYKQVIPSSTIDGLAVDGLFGEEISLYTGELSFATTDINLPGNNALDVSFRRKLSLNDTQAYQTWKIDLPHLEGVYPEDVGWTRKSITTGATGRCSSGAAAPRNATGRNTVGTTSMWDPGEFWSGDYLSMPAAGNEEILKVISGGVQLPTDGATYKWVTKSGWRISCLTTAANDAGEGFLAVSPTGTKYYFDWFMSEPLETLTRPLGVGPAGLVAGGNTRNSRNGRGTATLAPVSDSDYLERKKVLIYPSKIIDRFGNQVTYTYGPDGPTTISATDGRTITIAYSGGLFVSATANGRTWTYNWTNGLTVTLPDSSTWVYSLAPLQDFFTYNSGPHGSLASVQVACDNPPPAYGGGTGTVKHPSGATGTFTVGAVRHGRSYVDRTCPGYTLPDNTYYGYAYRPYIFDTRSLKTKTISGPGLTTATWQYAYGPPNNSWASNCSAGCATTKYVEVTDPTGTKVRHTYSNRYQGGEGRELTAEVINASGVTVRRTDYTYQFDATGQPYPARLGMSGNARGDYSSEKFDPLRQTTISQDGVTFTNGVNTFDHFARPTSVTKSSAPAP
ncbi:hypothetical protein [Lysobacter sp. CFH 32150]|uniref:hypothetical protein n=1 Tax=Lysobacter sp. CFH 32150 TaxID=2927128 RepID=UPI001FA728AB|nr:hypothetical protein [Lysobacter sp. CFH 32150]MCI4569369.1 hypothetical protein [Lysobacter sp. CFH 32150]